MLTIITQVIWCFLLLFIFVVTISIINSFTEVIICSKMGHFGRIFFSIIGTPIHELSHAFMCIIFGHKIIDMKLLITNPNSSIAGYVNHSWNKKNPYQNIGNFFIGIAPVFCGFSIVYIIYKIFMNTPKNIVFWIGLFICQQIIIHMRCSKADLKNSLYGLLLFMAIIALIGCLKISLIISLNSLLIKIGIIICAISGLNFLVLTIILNRGH